MSCRVVAGEKTLEAQPINWSAAGATAGPGPERPAAKLYADPTEAGDHKPAADVERIAEAYQRGLREGDAAATQRMSQQVSAKIEQLSRSIEQLAMHRGKIQREAEPELVRLSLAIARRILRRELSVDPESLLGLVKAGLNKVESSEVHRVRVHPEHASILA